MTTIRKVAAISAAVALALGVGVGASSHTSATSAAPQAGGTLVYGIPGEPTGFNMAMQPCSQDCQLVARALYDPLMALDADLNAVPYLAESVEPNADFTEWTITLRAGVTFHDGTPLTAAIVKQNLEAYATPPSLFVDSLSSKFDTIEAVDDLTAVVTMQAPWPAFPIALTAQAGHMMSSAMIDAGLDGGLEPVGTGPFRLEEWSPGESITLVRNEDYWQEGLPYLDSVVFRPMDPPARTAAFDTGEIDAIMIDAPEQIANLQELENINLNLSTEAASTDEWVLNASEAPTSDIRVRQALAYAFDAQTYAEVLGAGVVVPANGPFPPGTIGYLEDSGHITFDLDKARALVDEYEAENGPLALTIKAAQDKNTAAQLVQSMFQEAGIDVEIEIADGTVVITDILQGNYEVVGGALPGNVNPAEQSIWWSSANIAPLGETSTNYARIDDEVIDGALDVLNTESDPEVRRAAAEDINRRFAEQTYAVWTYWTVWATGTAADVHDIVGIELPDGQISDNTNQGLHFLTRTWRG